MNSSKNQAVYPMNVVDYQDLIIDNPKKQAFWIRWGFHLLTLLFWAMWFYLWTPLPGLVKNLIFNDFTVSSLQPSNYVIVAFSLLVVLGIWQVGWVTYNKKRFNVRDRRSKKKESLSNEELVQFFTVDDNQLEYWQQCKCMVMHHHDTGEIEAINVNDLFSFAPSLPKPEEVDLNFQRYYITLIPKQSYVSEYMKSSIDFMGIMKVLCAVFKIRFISCEQKKNNLYLTVDIPVNYKVENLVRQLKLSSSSVINKKLNLMEENESFWDTDYKVSKRLLPKQMAQKFVRKSVRASA